MIKKQGVFITVEGIEGAGKSTVMQFMLKYLQEQSISCITTREFGGTEIAETIRHVLLDYHYKEKMCQETEILLAFASRAQHVSNLIKPTLANGSWVLCDRFTDSSYAYQGYGRGVCYERIKTIADWVLQGFKPNYTFLLDLNVSTGFKRLKQRSNKLDRIESEEHAFFQKVRNGFLKMAQNEPQRYIVINAEQQQDEVLQDIQQHLNIIIAQNT